MISNFGLIHSDTIFAMVAANKSVEHGFKIYLKPDILSLTKQLDNLVSNLTQSDIVDII